MQHYTTVQLSVASVCDNYFVFGVNFPTETLLFQSQKVKLSFADSVGPSWVVFPALFDVQMVLCVEKLLTSTEFMYERSK